MFRNILVASNLLKRIITNKLPLRNFCAETEDIIFKSIGDKGLIILNRPKALNALNLSVISKLLPVLLDWEQKKSLVIVKGSGERAFSAGTDVKAIYLANKKGDKLGHRFFKAEYTAIGVIGTYKIPYVAFVGGIFMGGGVGLSVHGRYRIATENSLFAMPETQIALFPDAGCSYFLPRLCGKLGLYLALTGQRLKGYDIIKAGIATHYVDTKNLSEIEHKLLNCCSAAEVKKILKQYSKCENVEFSLAPHMSKINDYFNAKSLEGIMKHLKKDSSTWGQETFKVLNKMSPTSMKVAIELLKRGAKLTLKECLRMEYDVAYNTMNKKEFYEAPQNYVQYIISFSHNNINILIQNNEVRRQLHPCMFHPNDGSYNLTKNNCMSSTALSVFDRELFNSASYVRLTLVQDNIMWTCFRIGVRALLVDKDMNPKWNPDTIEDVPAILVQKHFDAAPDGIKNFRHESDFIR